MEIQINVDCADLDRMVDFYTAALGLRAVRVGGETYRSIVPADGAGPKLVFQKVPEGKVVKNRMHLDLIVGDRIEAEAERFVALGAPPRRPRRRSRRPARDGSCSRTPRATSCASATY